MDNLFNCALDVCIGKYWFEIATRFVHLLINALEKSAAIEVSPE
jgi:hypothetical protein